MATIASRVQALEDWKNAHAGANANHVKSSHPTDPGAHGGTHPADRLTDAQVNLLLSMLNEPTPTPEPVPLPSPAPGPSGFEVQPGVGTIKAAIAAGQRNLVLRGGVYSDSFGSAQRGDVVTLTAYPGEEVIIDGSGQPQNFVYLGPGAHWTLTRIKGRNFRPTDSGVLGYGDGHLTLIDCEWAGLGPVNMNSHLVYGFGTGEARITRTKLTKAPGAALHAYRGTPRSVVTDSELGGLYESALLYSGSHSLTGVRFAEPSAAWDVEVKAGVGLTLAGCLGTGVNGAVRKVTT